MKTYILIVDEKGVDFLDKRDKGHYQSLISSFRNKGITKFCITISPYEGRLTSEKQVRLWNVIKSFVSNESGNDFKTVEETLNTTGKEIKDMTNKEFSDLIEHSFSIMYDMFNVQLIIDENGNIQKL